MSGARREAALGLSAAAVSGVLVASIWLPPAPPWAICFAFAPLLTFWIRAERARDVFWTGFAAQALISAIAFAWIATTLEDYHGLSRPAAIVGWLAAAATANLHIALIGGLWWWVARRHKLGPLAASSWLAVAFVGLAQLYPRFLPFDYGYPWLWSGLPILHLADWVGFRGLGGVTLWINALVAFAACARGWAEATRLLLIGAAVVLALQLLGAHHARSWSAGDRTLRVAVIQPNFPWSHVQRSREPGIDVERLGALLDASREAHARRAADLWIWPETSLYRVHRSEGRGHEAWLSRRLAEDAVPIVLGLHWGTEGRVYNTAALYDRQGEVRSRYHKQILFPFGEYVPVIGSLLGRPAVYAIPSEAEERGVIELEGVQLGLTICFEALFPDLLRSRADAGAQVFVNLASDQAFGDTAERYQHLYMALARAIELRRPLIRVATTGVSAVITRTGELIAVGPPDRSWRQTVPVPYASVSEPTLFQRFGHAVEPACLAIALGALAALEWSRRRTTVCSR